MFATGRVSLGGSETSRLIHGKTKGIFGGVGSRRDVCCVHLEVMHNVAWSEVFLAVQILRVHIRCFLQKSIGFYDFLLTTSSICTRFIEGHVLQMAGTGEEQPAWEIMQSHILGFETRIAAWKGRNNLKAINCDFYHLYC